MIALAGRNIGYRFATLDPTPDSPCGQAADKQIVGAFDDIQAARELARLSDVVTYEFENVDADVARQLETDSYVPQGSELLRITQHRVREKTTLASFDVPVAPFETVETEEDLRAAVQKLGLPCVMKTATGGYDGKGQWMLRTEEDIPQAFSELSAFGAELIVEQYIPFAKELSVVAARSSRGETKAFPVGENIHVDNILRQTIVPARVDEKIKAEAERLALKIAESLRVVGLIAVEMFLTEDGELIVNELAPRPHNSGHYTMDACVTSQFEQHVRAICGLPLGSVELLSPVVMMNVLGEHLPAVMDRLDQLPATAKLHLYGKAESRPQRKMGHINFVAPTAEEALRQIERLNIWKTTEEDGHD